MLSKMSREDFNVHIDFLRSAVGKVGKYGKYGRELGYSTGKSLHGIVC
jgi:hypothetical protein